LQDLSSVQTADGLFARKLTEEMDAVVQITQDAEKWIALIKQCSHPTELTTELLNTVIEKIVVHEAVKGTDKVILILQI